MTTLPPGRVVSRRSDQALRDVRSHSCPASLWSGQHQAQGPPSSHRPHRPPAQVERFTRGAETRYAPVEGEALAVAWSLEATRHYTLGNSKLIVATDHKPLLKILGDRKLEEIDNPRLLKLKEKTLRWQFDIIHVPGKTHIGPDTLSRKEVTIALTNIASDETPWDETDMELIIEHQIAAAVPAPISWQQIREEVSRDKVMGLLADQISDGFPPDKKLLRLELRSPPLVVLSPKILLLAFKSLLNLKSCPDTKHTQHVLSLLPELCEPDSDHMSRLYLSARPEELRPSLHYRTVPGWLKEC